MELGHHEVARAGEVAYFYLYVMLDVFSRYVVGWMVTVREHRGHVSPSVRRSPLVGWTS